MRRRDQDRGSLGDGEALDDATVEDLLAGRYRGHAPDVVAVSKFLDRVRSFADRPVPPPSAALTRLLTEPEPAGVRHMRKPNARPLGGTGPGTLRPAVPRGVPSAGRHGSRLVRVSAVAAAVSTVLVALAVAAGSARLLPGPAQDVVARLVRTVTPFDFPEDRKSEAVPSRAPSADSPRPVDDAPADAGHLSSQPEEGQPSTSGGQPAGADATAGRPHPGRADPAIARDPEAEGANPDGTTRSAPRRPPDGHGFGAELSGATDDPAAADSDGRGTAVLVAHPRRDELCLALVLSDVAPVASAHLHEGPMGVTGAVVVTFVEIPESPSERCVTVPDEVIKAVRRQPGNFYIDVHTTEFPSGALRGQLKR